MKINTGRLVQNVNALLILVVCIYYSSLYDNYIGGLSTWGISLMYLYFFDLVKSPEIPEFDMKARIILSSLGGWGISFFMLGIFLDIQPFYLVFVILLLVLFVWNLYYWKYFSHKKFNLALIISADTNPHNSEPCLLEDIEKHIQNYVNLNHVELLDPIYSEENMRIINEPEWHSLTEFKNRESLPQQREEEFQGHVFSCLLSGKWKYLTAIKTHITDHYLREGKVRRLNFVYSRDKLHIVGEREWKAYEDFYKKS